MTNHVDDFEPEEQEDGSPESDLLPEDKENLEKAMNDCVEIFSAPGQADPDNVFEAKETLEEVYLCFSDTQISDQIGEVVELLHEISEETVLSFEDAQTGRQIIQDLAQDLGIHLSHPDCDSFLEEKGLTQ